MKLKQGKRHRKKRLWSSRRSARYWRGFERRSDWFWLHSVGRPVPGRLLAASKVRSR